MARAVERAKSELHLRRDVCIYVREFLNVIVVVFIISNLDDKTTTLLIYVS